MALPELFLSFLLIGFTSFGGTSMIPLVNGEMLSHGWMTAEQVADIVAIAEMTPGPLGLNCATFAGMRVAGLGGALAASLGVVFPSFSLCLLAAVCFEAFKSSRIMEWLMTGVRPACIGLVFGVMFAMALSTYLAPEGGVELTSLLIGLLDGVLLLRFKVGVPAVIILSAVLGLLFF